MKDKEYHVANLQLLFPKLLLFPSKKWMSLISDQLSTASIKYLNVSSPVFGWFQNGCNKVVEPHVMQFLSEILLVISGQTHAAHPFDFEIMHMISAQIALHSVQLPLLIFSYWKMLLMLRTKRLHFSLRDGETIPLPYL